jgi:hypothetical protein
MGMFLRGDCIAFGLSHQVSPIMNCAVKKKNAICQKILILLWKTTTAVGLKHVSELLPSTFVTF